MEEPSDEASEQRPRRRARHWTGAAALVLGAAMSGAPAFSDIRDLAVPAPWRGTTFLAAPAAGAAGPDAPPALPPDHVRLHSGPVDAGLLAVAEPLWPLVPAAPQEDPADITAAAARAGVVPADFAPPPDPIAKRTRPNTILAATLPGGAVALFVGRIAVDAPGAPVAWTLLCKAAPAAERGLVTGVEAVAPSSLLALADWICAEADRP